MRLLPARTPAGALRQQYINCFGGFSPRPQTALAESVPNPGLGDRQAVPGPLTTRARGCRLPGAVAHGTWMRFRWNKAMCTQPGTSPGSSSEPFPLRILQVPCRLRLRAAAVGPAPHSASSRSRRGHMPGRRGLGGAGCRMPRRPRSTEKNSRTPLSPPRPGPAPALPVPPPGQLSCEDTRRRAGASAACSAPSSRP